MDLGPLVFFILPLVASATAMANYQNDLAIDPLMIGLTFLGILLFYKAPTYARSATFYYVCSLVLGCLGSLLVIFFIISRYVPKKFAYATLFFGYSSMGFMYSLFRKRIYQHIMDYGTYIFWYTLVAAFITFAFAYRYGPPSHPKTLHLVQWTCQLISLTLIMLSNELPIVGLSISGFLIVHYNFSHLWNKLAERFRAPEPRALLTEEEFYLQGTLTTQEELRKLRDFCQSPEINPWKVIHRLKTPDKFAKFMVTGEDVTEEERTLYDSSCFEDSDEPNEESIEHADKMVDDMIENMDTSGDHEVSPNWTELQTSLRESLR